MGVHNVIRILLLAATVSSYIPQYIRLFNLRSSNGISIAGVFLSALVAQCQAANMYFLFKAAPQMRYGIPIATPPSAGDWLNLAQILIQWAGSLLLLLLVIAFHQSSGSSPGSSRVTPIAAIPLLLLQAILFTIAAAGAGRPDDFVFAIITNINASIINPLLTILAVVAYICQARITRSAEESSALSGMTLVMQSLTFLVLAVAWPFRLKLPPNLWQLGKTPTLLMEWYPWVGWACVNNAILGAGQAVVWFIMYRAGRRSQTPLADEARPLLRS